MTSGATPRREATAPRAPSAKRPTLSERVARLEATLEARSTSDHSIDQLVADALAKISTPDDLALAQQKAAFDRMMAQRAELLREQNVLHELAMEQIKRDDELMKQWIKMI